MSKVNKLIRISGILSVIFALLFFEEFDWYQTCQLGIGILLLGYSNLSPEELVRKKIYIVITAVISLFLNVISAILLFVVYDELTGNKQQNLTVNNNIINSESRKIDVLLKVGIIMILVSGVLFATSSWELMPDIVKCIGLLLLSGIFIGLSKFSETKLKIEKTTKAYYIIGLCFGLLTFVGIGFFGIFSNWFSYVGTGHNLVWFITFILLSGMLYLISVKFKELEYKYMALFVGWISLYYLLSFIGLGLEFIGLLMTVILLLINILLNDNKFKMISNVSRIISYVYWPILMVADGTEVIVIVSLIIAIINMLYLTFENNSNTNVMAIVISYLLGIEAISRINVGDINIIIFIGATIFYCLINCSKIKVIKNINQIIYNIIVLILIVFVLDSAIKVFIVAIIYGIVHFVNYFIINKNDRKFDMYYQPMVIFLIIFGIIKILNEVININEIYYFLIPTLLYAGIDHWIIREERVKKIYYIYMLVLTILTLLMNIFNCEIIVGILLILLTSYIFLRKKKMAIWTYILLLVSILSFKDVLYDHVNYGMLWNFLNILVFGGLTYLFKDNVILRKINLISIVIPLYALIGFIKGIDELKLIFNNILNLYILFIIVTQFVKDDKTKDVIATIFTALLLLEVIFVDSLLVGLYVGVLGIILIILAYNNKNFKALFYCGVIVTILNILVKLGKFWTKIPLSVYLLLAGGVLIAFVTFKELKNKDSDDSQRKKLEERQIKTERSEERMNFCPTCGSKGNGNKFCAKCGTMLIKK